MLKLILRSGGNMLYAFGQMLYDLDVFIYSCPPFFGAKGESISSGLWVASQTQPATASLWARYSYYVWKPLRVGLDWLVLATAGEAAHTQTAYNRYLAIKAAFAKAA